MDAFAKPLAVLTALLFATSGSTAQVIVTQGSALAGGITPGDEPGFPVSLSVWQLQAGKQSRGPDHVGRCRS